MDFLKQQNDAWGSRIMYDYPEMSPHVKLLFVINHYVIKACLVASYVFLIASVGFLVFGVHGTYLMGGEELLSDNKSIIYGAWYFLIAIALNWLIPSALNSVFCHFYTKDREKTKIN
jgi:hypothetical protein